MPIGNQNDDKAQEIKLIEIVRQVIAKDDELRNKHNVQHKFRFVTDRLNALLANLEGALQEHRAQDATIAEVVAGANEVVVYVHLFNAHGLTLRTWQNMLLPKVFYEYSVNRPIYAEKNQIEAVIKGKVNRAQHGYLMVAVKNDDVQKMGMKQKDNYGNDLIKIREGSLQITKLIAFMHNDIAYVLNEKGELVKKDNS